MALPIESHERPLRYLFLDFNSYFASVEQQEQPELRDRPIAVCPVMADSSFVIAASYEAKAFGVKTGTRIGDAKLMCPGIQLVPARANAYTAYHKRVIEAAETVLPVEEVCSIDEMRFRLLGEECRPGRARELALQIKRAIQTQVGECMRCSVGVAPNPFLAKLATELQKPDGLVILQQDDLPERLYGLELTGFTGINRKMEARLNAKGIFDAKQLLNATKDELWSAFGSVIGERWWYLLRGFDLTSDHKERKTLGHSHVLPPDLRNDQGCREVLLRLLQKGSARLRANKLWASGMSVFVKGEKSWTDKLRLSPTQDTVALNESFLEVWKGRDFTKPKAVGVTFYDLKEAEQVTPSLFDETLGRADLNKAVDEINQKFGKNKIFLAGMEHAKDTASEKIAFQKVELFQEGKGDHEWPDTFRGLPREPLPNRDVDS